jgi:hypothetical protein
VAGSLLAIAVVELFAGDLALSRALAEQAAEAFRPQGYRKLTAWTLQFAAELAVVDGHGEAARRSGAEAAALFAEVGCLLGQARAADLAAEMAAKSR